MNPNWLIYERLVFPLLEVEYSKAEVIYDLHVKGKTSESIRRIDIGIKIKKGRKVIFGIAEVKYRKNCIDIGLVDAIRGKCTM